MSPEGTTVRSGVAAAHETVYNAGLTERRDVLGDEYVDAALTRNAGTDGEALQGYVSEFVWGGVWTRDGLGRRDRSLVTVSLLIALGQHTELATHVRAGLRNGLTRREISEAVLPPRTSARRRDSPRCGSSRRHSWNNWDRSMQRSPAPPPPRR